MRQACQLFWAAGPAAGSGHSLPCRAADLGLRAARGCPRAAHLVRVRVVQAVARRQDQRTLVLVLLPTTLKTALCTVWSLALLGAIDTFRDHGACRMQGEGPSDPGVTLRPENRGTRPRYASTAPVALVRGYCVTPGLWGFP